MTITFDFDDTLTLPKYLSDEGYWGSTLKPNEEILSIMWFLHYEGYDIQVVTSRFIDEEVDWFLNAHAPFVSAVNFTEGKFKHRTLKDVDSYLHFDDSVNEAYQCESNGVCPCMLVVHPYTDIPWWLSYERTI